MIISDFRWIIQVKRYVSGKDTYGAINDTYSPYLELKCSIKFNGGNKLIENNEIYNTKTILITTHYRDIIESDIIVFKNEDFKILSIVEIGWKEGLQILAEKINN
jgi:hypothetical protein